VRRLASTVLLFGLAALAGCETVNRVGTAINPERLGFGARCANVTQIALPSGDIEFGNPSVADVDIRALVARVAGRRRDLPGNPSIAAECEFRDGILTAFRWIQGGPAPPAPPPALPPRR
jgi:hypothetical protein